jgi:hypothetical protein
MSVELLFSVITKSLESPKVIVSLRRFFFYKRSDCRLLSVVCNPFAWLYAKPGALGPVGQLLQYQKRAGLKGRFRTHDMATVFFQFLCIEGCEILKCSPAA